MLKGIIRKIKSDKASSSIISFLLLVPLLLGVVITAVDMSFYFSNRSQVEAIAGDAARTVGIFGGNGTATTATSIENRYGASKNEACRNSRPDIVNAPNQYIFTDASKSDMTPIECNVLAALANSTGLTSFSTKKPVTVDCGPDFARTIGTRTYCTINYTYDGMPGAPLSFIQARQDDGSSAGLLSNNIVTKSSESEVRFDEGTVLPNRRP